MGVNVCLGVVGEMDCVSPIKLFPTDLKELSSRSELMEVALEADLGRVVLVKSPLSADTAPAGELGGRGAVAWERTDEVVDVSTISEARGERDDEVVVIP